jgi:signal transduction histidine kinase
MATEGCEETVTSLDRVIFLVSADAALTHQLINELVTSGGDYQLPLAVSVVQARQCFHRVSPTVILLDESAAAQDKPGRSLEAAAAMLTEFAPVVVVANPARQDELAFLITSGAVDFVARIGNFLPVAAGLLERRVRLAAQAESTAGIPGAEPPADFGEILRHEVNNPLTGILGNAELLLAELRKHNGSPLTEAALQRLQTIAELAVRLRETVRRLSNAWESRPDHAHLT